MAETNAGLVAQKKIFCVVEGEPRSKAFSVDIFLSDTVGQLKEIIKENLDHDFFCDIEAQELVLWHVDIPFEDPTLEYPVRRRNISDDEISRMSNTDTKLSLILDLNPSDQAIYFIIDRPAHRKIGYRPPKGTLLKRLCSSDEAAPSSKARSDLKAAITKITDSIFAPGSTTAVFLNRFVQGHEQLPLTTSNVPGLPRAGLLLDECRPPTPNLLFLDLPDPSKNDASPSSSSSSLPKPQRSSDTIQKLLEKTNKQILPLLDVRGSGKTRGLVELLSQRWGFYLNCDEGDLGSTDMTLLKTVVANSLGFSKQKFQNNSAARKMTYMIFLCRLLVLAYCLRVPESSQTFTCARWTLLQVCPYVFGQDVFRALFAKFSRLIDIWATTTVTEKDLLILVQEEYRATRNLLVEFGGLSRFPRDAQLLVVLDEAQLFGFLGEHFESITPDKSNRPPIAPVVRGLQNIADKTELTVITAGTKRCINSLDWVQGFGTPHKRQELDDFASLDFPRFTDQVSIKAYVSRLRDLLPNKESKQALDEALPSEAIEMILERFAGRMGPIINVISRILSDNNVATWQDVLCYFESIKIKASIKCIQRNFGWPMESQDREVVEIHLALLKVQHCLFGVDRLFLVGAVPELMEKSLGRIIKTLAGKTVTVINEPLILKIAIAYFSQGNAHFNNVVQEWVKLADEEHGETGECGSAWQLMMMSVLAETFRSHALSDWPHAPSISSMSTKLEGHAEIVGLNNENELEGGTSCEHMSIKEFMNAHANNNSVRQGQPVPAFFFPEAKPSGPDMVFYIRVKESLVPVFLQLKLRQIMVEEGIPDSSSNSVSDQETNAVQEEEEEEEEEEDTNEFYLYCPAKVCISMILEYPSNLITMMPPRPDLDLRTLAIRGSHLQQQQNDDVISGMEQVVIKVDDQNFAEIFPEHHVEFLDSIRSLSKKTTKRVAKNELEGESPKRTKV
ncbi:hypothetical protein BGZ83_009586 [Gryganskiella cystojenkinii]|nr:hypothetical protein BGZ83_009586 [Gryganskiella cystojenkinii]